MRPDIQGLEITKGEIKYLSGVGMDRVYRPATVRKFVSEGLKSLGTIVLLAISCLMLVLILPRYYLWVIIIHLIIAIGLVFEDAYKIFLSYRNKSLVHLFDDVERYNTIVKSIEIHDRVAEAGNPKVQVPNRDKVIPALKLIREDLVRALKTERILRENQQVVANNSELFANNLKALTALQINDRIGEQGRLLNEALKLAAGVQEEMKKLQKRSSAH